jgi:hypothetical protein
METELRNCLRALPRAKASPAFTFEVRRKLRESTASRPRAFVWRAAAAFAMAACLIAVVQIGVLQYQRQQRLEELRIEQQQIQAELAALKKSAGEAEPMVVLENDHGARVIMDLDSAVQHASYRSFD